MADQIQVEKLQRATNEIPLEVPESSDRRLERYAESALTQFSFHKDGSMIEILQVITTVDTSERAAELATALVNERLAACVQIDGPITSYYRWQGTIQNDHEFRCTIKTTLGCWERLQARLAELHPYDVPELLATHVNHASESYAQWLRNQVE